MCDSSFSTCGGCAALATDRANQLSIAQANCNYKSSFVCTLASKSGGGYDYAALSTLVLHFSLTICLVYMILKLSLSYSCCLGSRPPGPAACMCEFQQSASALCLLNGACLGTGTCQKSSLTCVGTSTAQPLAVCTVPGSLTCSFSGSTEVDLTWFVLVVYFLPGPFYRLAFSAVWLEEPSTISIPPLPNAQLLVRQARLTLSLLEVCLFLKKSIMLPLLISMCYSRNLRSLQRNRCGHLLE